MKEEAKTMNIQFKDPDGNILNFRSVPKEE